MIAAITTVFYLAGILAAVEAVMTARTAQGAIAWSVALVAFPFVALPAYLVFGRSKFEGMLAAYEKRKGEIDGLVGEVQRNLDGWAVPSEDRPADAKGADLVVAGGLGPADATFDDRVLMMAQLRPDLQQRHAGRGQAHVHVRRG